MLDAQPDSGLRPVTLGSGQEPKSRVRCPTDRATRGPRDRLAFAAACVQYFDAKDSLTVLEHPQSASHPCPTRPDLNLWEGLGAADVARGCGV